MSERLAVGSSRRGFLARVSAAVMGLAGARSLVQASDAEAYHFCGHIYTTDSCPHPSGLPRIDSKGFALRAADGHRIDDLGRPIDSEGRPLDEQGRLLTDAEGRPLPGAPRTRVCDAVGERFDISTQIDGSWYRCCSGRVRKLVDCCTTGSRRINGDRALRGYCYKGRKVFCVLYYDTNTRC